MKQLIVFSLLSLLVAATLRAQPVNPPEENPPQGWYQQNSGVTKQLGFLSFIDKDRGWAGDIYTTNGGNTWLPYNKDVNVMRFVDSNFGYGYSGKGAGYVAVTTNGGETWNSYETGYPKFSVIYFVTPSRGFGFTGINGRITRTLDGGKTWTDYPYLVGDIETFVAFDSLHIVASGYKLPDSLNNGIPIASVFLTTDGGDSWKFTMKNRQPNAGYSVFAAFSNGVIYSVGGDYSDDQDTRVHKSNDYGKFMGDCTMQDGGFTGSDRPASGFATNPNNASAVGTSGIIFRTRDGINWERQISGTKNVLRSVYFIDSTTGWAVGDGGVILHTTNGGFASVHTPSGYDSLHVDITPNPSNETLTLTYTLALDQHITISLLDISGHVMQTPITNVMQIAGAQTIPLDVHSMPSGIYLLRIQSEQFQSIVNCSIIH